MPACPKCNAPLTTSWTRCGMCRHPRSERKALDPSDATACSRIADPEGKHVEICRLQLAAVVSERDKFKAAYEVAIYNLICVAGYGHPGVKQATDIVDYAENDKSPDAGVTDKANG